jgi:hypothetical protein
MANTNFINGVTNVPEGYALGQFPMPDPSSYHTAFDDFDTYTAAQWTVTETDAAATQALSDADGGVIVLTNATTANDINAMQLVNETFLLAVGKQTFFKARFKLSDVTNPAMQIGLQPKNATPQTFADGILFTKAAAATTLNISVAKDSTATTSAVATLANDTYVSVGFWYNGSNAIVAYLNEQAVATLLPTNLCDNETLSFGFGTMHGASGSAEVLSVDYIFVAKER